MDRVCLCFYMRGGVPAVPARPAAAEEGGRGDGPGRLLHHPVGADGVLHQRRVQGERGQLAVKRVRPRRRTHHRKGAAAQV